MGSEKRETYGLTDEQLVDMYRVMLLTRRLDERIWLLNRAGKVPFAVSCTGQEGAQAGAAFALEKGKDYTLPYYRDLAFVLTMGMTAKEIMLNTFAKAEDPNSGGRQMPAHYGYRALNMLTQSSPVGTQIPHAVGVALAAKMEKKDFVTFVSLGEGSTNQGDFHEGLNFAGIHKLPVICFCENNKYAISVPQAKQIASKNVADRAVAYGFPGVEVDGNDPLEVYRVVREAVERARAGEGPTLIEAVTYRLLPHSSDDDDMSYRTKEEVEEAKKNDSLILFANRLKEWGILNEDLENELEESIAREIDEATDYAENVPFAEPDTLYKHVYADR